jgi:hypothetical protein
MKFVPMTRNIFMYGICIHKHIRCILNIFNAINPVIILTIEVIYSLGFNGFLCK